VKEIKKQMIYIKIAELEQAIDSKTQVDLVKKIKNMVGWI